MPSHLRGAASSTPRTASPRKPAPRPPASGRALALALALAAGCHAPPTPIAHPPPLRLVVLVVIDQWPSWSFAAHPDRYRHGLRRLIDEGAVFPRVSYPYTPTLTAPGHAALATGAPPAVTGIIANGWHRRDLGRRVAAEHDEHATVFPLSRAPTGPVEGASGAALRADGIADVLEAASDGAARTVAIAGKARSACLMIGRKPDLALWYEPALAAMTTSTAYVSALPTWVVALDAAHPIAPRLDDEWTLDDPAAAIADTGVGQDDAGKAGAGDLGTMFPHRLAGASDPADALAATPFLDEIEVDAAIAAVDGEQMGHDDIVDLLAVSFSAHDNAGHLWGQESWELFDLERRLDRQLARLLEHLDRQVGSDRYAVVVTSDHGATPLVERGRYPGARRITPTELEAAAEEAAATVAGPGDWIAAVSSGMIYASPALLGRRDRDAALDAITARVERVANVARAVRLDQLAANCPEGDGLIAAACAANVRGESGELLVVPIEGSLITSHPSGTAHDAASRDNREVPVIVRVPRPYVRVEHPLPSALSIAPTLAALLGIPPPPAATEPSLVAPAPRHH